MNEDVVLPKALRSPSCNPMARGTMESFYDARDGTRRVGLSHLGYWLLLTVYSVQM